MHRSQSTNNSSYSRFSGHPQHFAVFSATVLEAGRRACDRLGLNGKHDIWAFDFVAFFVSVLSVEHLFVVLIVIETALLYTCMRWGNIDNNNYNRTVIDQPGCLLEYRE